VGYVHAENGIGELPRGIASVMQAAGIPYQIVARRGRPADGRDVAFPREDLDWPDLGDARDPAIVVAFENANTFPNLVASGGLAGLDACYRVGYWAWEVDEFPERDVPSGDLVDEVWTLSEHSARAIASAVDAPVYVVPPPIRAEAYSRPAGRTSPDDPFRVLVSFDALSIPGRKNPAAAIAAYQRAFDPEDGAELVVKLVNARHAEGLSGELERAIRDRDDITVHEGYLDRDQYVGLVSSADAYLSLHRAEGFGYTLAEAMAAGKPVVGTGYSGNLEFMTDENSMLVDYTLVPVGPAHDPYPPTARWAEPDIDAAADALRRLHADPVFARDLGERARADVARLHDPMTRAPLVDRRVRDAAHRPKTRVGVGAGVGVVEPASPPAPPRGLVWRVARRGLREVRWFWDRRRRAHEERARRRARASARRAADALRVRGGFGRPDYRGGPASARPGPP
jgi:glycosyltransferase involved in cell wall biosynthesis